MREGDHLHIFNGRGQEFNAEITSIKKTAVRVCVHHEVSVQAEPTLSISLGQCISRGDRMDYAIQKACELGVTNITPLISEHCQLKLNLERLQKRMTHWQGIIINAAQQCGRATLPSLFEPEQLLNWVQKAPSHTWLCIPNQNKSLAYHKPKKTRLIIGPEGGLSKNEIDAAMDMGCTALGLGPRILRTETATVVGLSIMQYQWGDLRPQNKD